MVSHQIERPARYSGYENSRFEEYELKPLAALGLAEIWYWYQQGQYEGAGMVLMRREAEGRSVWDSHDCGHCSCYGPTEDVKFTPHDSLQDLGAQYSEEARRDLDPCLDAARQAGWS